jgi:diguanylate cyclase (GGDEF)-like protein/PAS domain S-box-containing protein
MILQTLKKQLSLDIVLVIFLVLLSVFFNQVLLNKIPLLQRWDNLFYDLESTGIATPADKDIVIVAIDDVSLKKMGRWPWSRAIHAHLIDQLTEAGAVAVAMDILFMDPDLTHPENDQLLASAIHRNGHVILPALTTRQDETLLIIKPLKMFAEAARQLAHVNIRFDSQGIARQFELQLELDDDIYLPAMSLALSRLLLNHNEPENLTEQNRVLIQFAGPPGHFQHISYADVVSNIERQKQLAGKTVLIGITATGLGSRVATPASQTGLLMSGVEFQANALATLQSGKVIRLLQWPAYTLISFSLITLLIILFRFLSPFYALLLVFGFSILTVASSFFLLSNWSLWFAPLPTLLCLILSYPLWSRKKLEQLGQSLFREHERASATLEAIAEAVITTDHRDRIEFMNPAAEKLLASPLAKVKRKPFSEVCQIIKQADSILINNRTLATGEQQTKTHVIRNGNGEEYDVQISSSLMYDEKKRPNGAVYALSDLTEIIDVHRKVAFIASHDTLTGLPNRVLLQDRLEQSIISSKRGSLRFAVLFIDLDGFKRINDAMGHASGDLLLQEVALRLRKVSRKSDTVSRWGGDEFIILLNNLNSPSSATKVASKIIQSLSQPIIIKNQEVIVTPSIGISLFPEDGEQATVLLEKSDTAMYNVKKSGRNHFCFYSQKLENQAKARLVLEAELRRAIESNEFEMHYQPQIDLISHELIGAEALIRWNHPDKGLVSPDSFIPLAEETGLIVPLGKWIIKKVCSQLQLWKSQGFPLIKVAINLSAHQFTDKNLVSTITQEIRKHGLTSESIQVEITESMMIQDIDRVIKILDDLKSAGVSIAVDDFGTGYSSLEYLKKLPIDKLKIDKSFVDSVMDNTDDASIVQAVIALGHNMNMQIIAEGVETEQQASFLKEHLCDYGQGYFYSRPLNADKMKQLMEKFERQKNAY